MWETQRLHCGMLRKPLQPAANAFREAASMIRNGDFLFYCARYFRRPYLTWKLGQHEEKEFWDSYFRTKGLDWPHEYRERTSPDFQLPDYLVELLEGRVGYEVQILDVGSGPLTAVGTKWPQHFVKVVAVDPLADWYEYLFSKHHLIPHVKPIRGKALIRT
jgi:hypothetical protein